MTDSIDFAYGDALSALFGPDYVQFLPQLIEQGKRADRVRDDFILEWGGPHVGARSYIKGTGEGRNEFVAAWPFRVPFASEATHGFTVDAITSDSICSGLRLIYGSVQGVAITAFADCLDIPEAALEVGETLDVALHGWASHLEMAPTGPIVIQREDANEGLLETFRTEFEREGKLVIETSQVAAFLSCGSAPSPLYEIQGEVRTVQILERLDWPALANLQVLVARPDEADGELLLRVLVSSENWPGDFPKAGDHVRGLIWLQAVARGVAVNDR